MSIVFPLGERISIPNKVTMDGSGADAYQLLNTPTANAVRKYNAPVFFKYPTVSRNIGQFDSPLFVFQEENQRRGVSVCFSETMFLNAKLGEGYFSEAVIGKLYMHGAAGVTKRLPGSGGTPGTIGGWATTGGTNASYLGQNASGTAASGAARSSQTFVETGDVFGVVLSGRADGGYVVVLVDGDRTKANGPYIETFTQQDVDCGRIGATITLNDGTTTIPAVGTKYINTRLRIAHNQVHYGIYRDDTYQNISHTIELVTTANNLTQGGDSNCATVVNAWFVSSPSLTAMSAGGNTNGVITSTSSVTDFIFSWCDIDMNMNVHARSTVPPTFSGNSFVLEFVMSDAWASFPYYFNSSVHADGSSLGQTECGHHPQERSFAVGTNNAIQPVLNVLAGDGARFANNNWIYINGTYGQLRQISSIATDALTLTSNLTYACNAQNAAAEQIILCETIVNGAVTANKVIPCTTSVGNIKVGDVITLVRDGFTFVPITRTVMDISGLNITVDEALTIDSTTTAIIIVSRSGYENHAEADSKPIFLLPGYFWVCNSEGAVYRNTTTYNAASGTTVTATALKGATSLTVADSSKFLVGELMVINNNGLIRQLNRVAALPTGTSVTLATPLDAAIRIGSAYTAPAIKTMKNKVVMVGHSPWPYSLECVMEDYIPRVDGPVTTQSGYNMMSQTGNNYASSVVGRPTMTITNITQASGQNAVVTVSAPHSFNAFEGKQEYCVIASVSGATQANANWPVIPLTSTTFALKGSSSVTFSPYVSGGTVTAIWPTFDCPCNVLTVLSDNETTPRTVRNLDAFLPVNGGGVFNDVFSPAITQARTVIHSQTFGDLVFASETSIPYDGFYQQRSDGAHKWYSYEVVNGVLPRVPSFSNQWTIRRQLRRLPQIRFVI